MELLELSFRISRLATEQCVKSPVGHAKPGAVIKVVEVQPETPVVLDIYQVVIDGPDEARLSKGGQTHQLMFAGIDFESGVIGKCGVQESQRMGEMQLLENFQVFLAADRQ